MTMTFALMGIVFVAMMFERWRSDIIAVCAMVLLVFGGLLTPQELINVFANQAVIAVACMFVLSSALERTGAIDRVGSWINRFVGQTDLSMSLVILPSVALLSAFANNTPVVLVFMPMVIGMAARRGIRPSKLLIPLSFASIFGGCCTLIGTSTNILVSSTAESIGLQPFGMFDLTGVGCILALVGMVYLWTIGRRLLPDRETLSSILQTTENKQFFTEAIIVQGSSLIGKRLQQTSLKSIPNARILEVIRGEELVGIPLDEVKFEAGDRIRLSTVFSSVMELKNLTGLEIQEGETEIGLEWAGAQKASVVECVISPRSSLIGKSIRQGDLRRLLGVLVLAVHRHGVNLRDKFESTVLQYGDTLLLEGTERSMRRLRESRDVIVLTDEPRQVPRRSKQWMAMGAIVMMVLGASFTQMPIAILALAAALSVVLMGCLEMDEAYRAVDWRIIFLIFGMLGMGAAMEKTGGIDWLASHLIPSILGGHPALVLSAVILMTSLLTTFLSNNAVAVVMTPIALEMAQHLDLPTKPFMIAVAIGASACFASPVGYQTNALVYSAGGYQFRDFVKVGLPLNLLIWLVASLVIPLLWPLT
ncbi:MAG: SLC13 family permease [Verrucomicrobiota bacterium]|nr:SLC13 family permease [Verrucomicrobiota bacterium]